VVLLITGLLLLINQSFFRHRNIEWLVLKEMVVNWWIEFACQ
tara:strand:- start:558 stop:683 length:126 start_codon:yes stop_codon:yes gene_type:complete